MAVSSTYAGGAQSMDDVRLVKELGQDKLDITVGSALDIFGGSGIKYDELVEFCDSASVPVRPRMKDL